MYSRFLTTAALVVGLWSPAARGGVNYEEAPIHYSKTPPDNIVSQLQKRITAGDVQLSFEPKTGYLRSLLEQFDLPISSQVLVFGKTSLQDNYISPKTPRAIYFNENIHLGFVQEGLIEIAVTDPKIGMVFYTLQQSETPAPIFRQEANSCLNCHGSGRTKSVPGVMVRSVFPDQRGEPVVAAGSFLSTTSSPLDQRWGGWYVTGTHGDQKHIGNMTLTEARKPKVIDNAAGQNVTDLSGRFDTSMYLSPHSDLVALMVLEHQTEVMNLITKAGFETRHALYVRDQAVAAGSAAVDSANTAASAAIEKAAKPLVDSLLFTKDLTLSAPISGTSSFATDFPRRGSHDEAGRSLRDLDLQTRLFKYRCSYLIDTPAFSSLPIELRDVVRSQLRTRLRESGELETLSLVDAVLSSELTSQ
jgi:hypothetical protein